MQFYFFFKFGLHQHPVKIVKLRVRPFSDFQFHCGIKSVTTVNLPPSLEQQAAEGEQDSLARSVESDSSQCGAHLPRCARWQASRKHQWLQDAPYNQTTVLWKGGGGAAGLPHRHHRCMAADNLQSHFKSWPKQTEAVLTHILYWLLFLTTQVQFTQITINVFSRCVLQ